MAVSERDSKKIRRLAQEGKTWADFGVSFLQAWGAVALRVRVFRRRQLCRNR